MIHAEITRKVKRTPTVETLYFDWPEEIKAGQFVMLWAVGIGEIPMSVSHIGEEKAFTIKDYGPTSRKLLDLEVGDKLHFRGPYGRPFTIKPGKRLLVGGGSGMASLHPLISSGSTGVIAAKTSAELLFKEEFSSENVVITTDDGSEGIKGTAIDGIDSLDLKNYTSIYACGPEIMLYNLYLKLKQSDAFVELSLERSMKCGIGVCDSCSIGGYQLCRDGPVFDIQQLSELNEFGREKLTASGKRVSIS